MFVRALLRGVRASEREGAKPTCAFRTRHFLAILINRRRRTQLTESMPLSDFFGKTDSESTKRQIRQARGSDVDRGAVED